MNKIQFLIIPKVGQTWRHKTDPREITIRDNQDNKYFTVGVTTFDGKVYFGFTLDRLTILHNYYLLTTNDYPYEKFYYDN